MHLRPSSCAAAVGYGLLLLAGCEQTPSTRADQLTGTAALQENVDEDAKLFAAAIRALDSVAPYPLRVDPRPLRREQLSGPLRDQLIVPERGLLEARSEVLSRLRIPQTNIVRDEECAFSQAYPPPPGVQPPGTAPQVPERCFSEPPFAAITLSLAPESCTGRSDGAATRPRRCTLRAVEVTPSSFLEYELSAEWSRTETGWQIVRINITGGAIS